MASLQNAQIDQSYQGLIKTTDNTALPLSGKVQITDGEGNASVLELGQQEAAITNATLYSGTASIGSDLLNDQFVFAGTQDFTQATVVGLPDAGIQSVVAGTNVTVDNTDPLNPIVSATGGSGAAGLVSGTGADSMKSADSLTTLPANASGPTSIALGNGATTENDGLSQPATDAIAIGNGATARNKNIAIGSNAKANGFADPNAIAIGNDTIASNGAGVVIGFNAKATGQAGIAIGGQAAQAIGTSSIAIGRTSTASGDNSIALGIGSKVNAGFTNGIAIGSDRIVSGIGAIAIGDSYTFVAAAQNSVTIGSEAGFQNGTNSVTIGAASTAKGTKSIAINSRIDHASNTGAISLNGINNATQNIGAYIQLGEGSSVTAFEGVAIGAGVIAAIADTVSVKALEVQTNSTPTTGGIIMADAGGTDRRINIDASGTLQIDSTPVVAASLSNTTKVTVTTTGADTLLQQITIPANTFKAGDILETYGMVSNDFAGGGTIYGNCFVGPDAGAIAGGIQLAGNATSTSAGFSTKRNIIIHTADGTGDGTSIPGIDSANNADDYKTGLYAYGDQNTIAIDWTQTQYFKFYTYIDNAGSSSTFHGMYIKKVN